MARQVASEIAHHLDDFHQGGEAVARVARVNCRHGEATMKHKRQGPKSAFGCLLQTLEGERRSPRHARPGWKPTAPRDRRRAGP